MTRGRIAVCVVLLGAAAVASPSSAQQPTGGGYGSAGNGRIAYSTGAILPDPDPEAGAQVFTINPDGTDDRQLTHVPAPAEAGDPSYSPDGRQIAYVSNEGGPFQLWVMRADGSGQHQLLADPTWDAFVPRWSPRGHHLVFTRCQLPFGFLECHTATVRADGTALRRLTFGHWADFAADYGPDGRIALSTNRDGYASRVYDYRAGHRPRVLTAPDIQAFWPYYSPDGSRILFGNNFDRPDTQTFTMRRDGSHVRLLSRTPGVQVAFARWSPDGKKIVFDYFDGTDGALAVMDSDGSHVRKIKMTSDLNLADWGRSA